jgi:hypothetical protein
MILAPFGLEVDRIDLCPLILEFLCQSCLMLVRSGPKNVFKPFWFCCAKVVLCSWNQQTLGNITPEMYDSLSLAILQRRMSLLFSAS